MLISDHPVLRKPRAAEIRAWRASKGDAWVRRLLLEREERIARAKADPYRHGYVGPHWERVDRQWEEGIRDVLVLGGNRSSKSEYAAREVMKVLVEKAGAQVWCFHSSSANSIAMQQPLVHKYLPAEWKDVRKGAVANVSYSQKGGFTEGTFVLPNGSQCWFRNYEQDEGKIEGGELDFIWADELAPASWLDTLRFRLVTRRGRMLVTFTPIEGYNATVKTYLQGARTLEWGEAELLPLAGPKEKNLTTPACQGAGRDEHGLTRIQKWEKGSEADGTGDGAEKAPVLGEPGLPRKEPLRAVGPSGPEAKFERVPLVQACIARPARVVYFHTKENPYGGYETLAEDLAGASRSDILCRAYGVPTRAMAQRFPKFGDWNVVRAETIPTEGTRYQVIDPSGGRNYFMIWAIFDAAGTCWIYREWPGGYYVPGWGIPRAWAIPSEKADGTRGPAQSAQGWGLQRYKEEVERLEGRPIEKPLGMAPLPARSVNERAGWRERRLAKMAFAAAEKGAGGAVAGGETIRERFMDIRAGNTTSPRPDRPVTLIEEWEELGVYFTGVTGRGSEGRDALDAGVHLVNDLLDWEPGRPMGVGNRPRLFVSEECVNVIYAMKEWTGLDGKNGACKDPVDCVHYLVVSGAGYAEEGALIGTAGGYW